jgi:hypothetical protein
VSDTPSAPPPAPKAPKPRTAGLVSIEQARKDRARGKYSRASPKVYAYIAAALVGGLVFYAIRADREVKDRRGKILAKQRSVAAELGPKWLPMQERIEATTTELAKSYAGDHVEPGLVPSEIQTQPGVYLRLRLAEAASSTELRTTAKESVKDGFVGCFSHATKASELNDAGAFPEQPWNLRLAYASTRILTAPWIADVEAADGDLRLRVFEQQLESAMKTEIPLAIEMVTRAKYFLVILDEDVPEAKTGDAGVTEESLQLVPHPARVALVDLATGKTLVRLRRESNATFLPVGENAVTDPLVRAAMQRQVNNCALARTVLAEMSKPR